MIKKLNGNTVNLFCQYKFMFVPKKLLNDLTYKIIGVAIEVHKYLGPGLPESVYQSCMYEEFRLMEIPT